MVTYHADLILFDIRFALSALCNLGKALAKFILSQKSSFPFPPSHLFLLLTMDRTSVSNEGSRIGRGRDHQFVPVLFNIAGCRNM